MRAENAYVQDIYDRNGTLLGLFVSAQMWEKIKGEVAPVIQRELDREERSEEREPPEPLQDWEKLKQTWGFDYAVDYDVHCRYCGSETGNWQEDEPRKFFLKAASISGLVSFECMSCHSRITKKHFKQKIVVETTPPQKG